MVISPSQVKNLRGHHGSADNKGDRFDAFELADTLRTDRGRMRPLTPDSEATIALRRACRARKDLVDQRVPVADQLRAHLRSAFPGAVGLFDENGSPINPAFLACFDPQGRAEWLSPKRTAAWRTSVADCGRVDPAMLHARLTAAPPGAASEPSTAQAHITRTLLTVLTTFVQQIKALSTQISDQLALQTDQHVYTNLPRSDRVRAARLPAQIGDHRARFSSSESLARLAGATPSTRQSGKNRTVGFRWACDKQLCDAVTDFTPDSRTANP